MKPKAKPMEQGLTTGEAAKMLGVITPTVIRYFNKGMRYPIEEVDRCIGMIPQLVMESRREAR